MKQDKKSQIVMIDLIMAIFVFIVLLTAILLFWNRYTITINKQSEYEEAQLIAYQVSDLFVKAKGVPYDWEKNLSNVHVIGLASSDRIISTSKVNAFLNISYNNSKKILNMPYYGYSFQIKDLQGNNLTKFYGGEASGDFTISLRRYIIYENEKAIMEFKLWK